MVTREQWATACEKARVEQCVDCEGQAYYNIHGVVDHDKHWPPVGDPAVVLAMLEAWGSRDEELELLHGAHGWWVEGVYFGPKRAATAIEAIVLAWTLLSPPE